MDRQTFFSLIDRYNEGTATGAEKALVEEYLRRLDEMGVTELSAEQEKTLKEKMYRQITSEISETGTRVVPLSRRHWLRYAAAGVIILLIGTGTYFLFFSHTPTKAVAINKPSQHNDVNPGSYKARLTLSDGRNIIVDSAALGELTKQGNTVVLNKYGQLIYKPEKAPSASSEESIVYNTVSTNKGETYSFTLADGSKVWLNSGSSIHFPVAFPGKERRIEITGEVYIKVAHNPQQPFIASANGMEVLALGTEFNINSYPEEGNISTTLINGVVRVSKQGINRLLKPGEQTLLLGDGTMTTPKEINIDEITAWKDGFFHFESADLKTILRQFARWYDIEVVYEGTVTNRKFFGIVKRSNTLKKVLEMLQDNNIVYQIEGKKLIVKSS